MKRVKKRWIIAGVVVLVIVAAILFVTMGLPYIRRHFMTNTGNVQEIVSGEDKISTDKRILTVYFTRVGNSTFEEAVDAVSSASLLTDGGQLYGNSQLLAMMVQDIAGGDIYAIQTKKKYSSGYGDSTQEARNELTNNERPALTSGPIDPSQYDTIVLVFPVWWGTYPMPVASFLDQYDFSGKEILPIVTNGGSSFGNSLEDLKENYKGDFKEGLAVYDDEVKEARKKIVPWLKNVL
ncbi:MAG: hypothetical protein J1F22_03145 [Lachnospiraceae bacterium]|nr:hypothetical protein [Lachnospiraceae bacterium]